MPGMPAGHGVTLPEVASRIASAPDSVATWHSATLLVTTWTRPSASAEAPIA
jgi:hypothetical protein